MMIAGTERRRQGCSLQDGKQWGLGNPSINFPIAFPKECFIAAITRAAGNYEHSIVITTKNKTNLSWICKGYDNSAGNTYANWLALGCQLQWGKPTVRGNNIFPIPFPNSALAITSAGIGGWHTVDVSIVNNNSYSVLGWATDSPSTARTSLPNVIAIGF